MNVLSLNPGSSSLKFSLTTLESATSSKVVLRGLYDRLGTPDCILKTTDETGSQTTTQTVVTSLPEAVSGAIEFCSNGTQIHAIGCRVVHGGATFSGPVVTDSTVLEAIRKLSPLAPLHNARDVETIEAAQSKLIGLPVVAVFDTSFHRSIPKEASTYALPFELIDQHQLQRFGFHGISYRYVTDRLRTETGSLPSRIIICHLGSGASACAVLHGKSIDTTMGFTPLEGLVMGTRSGDIDPGLVLYLQRELGLSHSEVDQLLNHKSGLAGLSGVGGDVRQIEKAISEGDPRAELALNVFCYRLAKYIGAYYVALEGLDAIVFCGGIGEHSATIRSRICQKLRILGISVAPERNETSGASDCYRIDSDMTPAVWVVETNEEQQIAKEVFGLLA